MSYFNINYWVMLVLSPPGQPLKFDLGLYGSEGGDLGFVVYAKHTRTWLNSLGAEWRNEVQLGSENLLATSLYQPLDAAVHQPRAPMAVTRQLQPVPVLDLCGHHREVVLCGSRGRGRADASDGEVVPQPGRAAGNDNDYANLRLGSHGVVILASYLFC